MIKKLFSKDYWIIKRSGLFDAEYYLRTYPDIREADIDPMWHYCVYGWREGRNPSSRFDTTFYIDFYRDIRDNNINPLAHYIRHGAREQRLTKPLNIICENAQIEIKHRILLISYYCPSRAHAGGLRILDIYNAIKKSYLDSELTLFTFKRPEIDWEYVSVSGIFDNIVYSDSEELSLDNFMRLAEPENSRFDIVDVQFHNAGKYIKDYKKIGKKVLYTPMESLIGSFFIDIKNIFKNVDTQFPKKILSSAKNAFEEAGYIFNSDTAIFVSKTDMQAASVLVPLKSSMLALETCISEIEIVGNTQEINMLTNSIVYVAYFGSETNIKALEWFLEFVHDKLISCVDDYRLYVVGRGDLGRFIEKYKNNVEFVGEVEFIEPYIKTSKVCIAPALSGSGFRGKINQYSYFGKPCVASPIAANGLLYENGKSIIVADSESEFFDGCKTLLKDDDLYSKISMAAYRVCLENYMWESKKEIISQIYDLDSEYSIVPLITILVPSYNHSKFLEQRIDSIFAQTYRNIEVLVIDDCSPDNSDEVLIKLQQKYDFQYIRNHENSGTPFSSWEKIKDLAHGRYIWICESDDYAENNFLETAVKFLTNSKNTVLFYSHSFFVDENGNHIGDSNAYFENFWHTDRWRNDFLSDGANEASSYQILGQTVPNMSSCLIRRDAYISAFSPILKKFKLAGDWLFIGFVMQYGNVSFSSEKLNNFRHHTNTSRAKTKSARSQAEYIMTKYLMYKSLKLPLSSLSTILKNDAVRFLYEKDSLSDVIAKMAYISVFHTFGLLARLIVSIAINPMLVKKFINRIRNIKGAA